VIAPPGIAPGVFVGQHAALGFEHRGAGEVLRRDQLDLALLAADLALDRGRALRVEIAEAALEEVVRGVEVDCGLSQGHRASEGGRTTVAAPARTSWRRGGRGDLRRRRC